MRDRVFSRLTWRSSRGSGVTPQGYTKNTLGRRSILEVEARTGLIWGEISIPSSVAVVVVVEWRGPSLVVAGSGGCCARLDAL